MNPSTGGPSQGIRNSIPELEKLGLHNEVVCLDDPSASFLGNDAFTIYALGPSKGPWCYSSKLMPWLLNNLGRFDAVIVHGLWLYHSYAISKAMSLLKRRRLTYKQQSSLPKLFIMPHGMLDPYFQRASKRKLKAVRNWAYWKLIEGKVVNKADGLLFTCEAELRLAREPFRPYQPKQEINVGYGIQIPQSFDPQMRNAFLKLCPTLGSCPYLLFLSRIHHKKGVDLLLSAYAVLLGQNRIMPKLVIAGPGLETAYGKKMQQIVFENSHLRNSVLFPGMLTGDAKWGAFYGCEAFVLPSHQENFGIAIVEALACAKPVLISNQVNIWREIEASGGGLVAEDTLKGTQELLDGWCRLPEKEKHKARLRARELYQTHFAIEPAAKQLMVALA
ncbi:MAG: glycosyltransferase [Chitinophagaceae bacterium]